MSLRIPLTLHPILKKKNNICTFGWRFDRCVTNLFLFQVCLESSGCTKIAVGIPRGDSANLFKISHWKRTLYTNCGDWSIPNTQVSISVCVKIDYFTVACTSSEYRRIIELIQSQMFLFGVRITTVCNYFALQHRLNWCQLFLFSHIRIFRKSNEVKSGPLDVFFFLLKCLIFCPKYFFRGAATDWRSL